MGEDDDFLSRWASRKRAVAEEERETSDRPAPKDEPKPTEPEVVEEETEEATLERFGLPSPESLGPGDDFSGFMQSGVPEYLRRRALRRLWRSNPVLANLDGLNDYDEDFTSPEETMKVLKTAYQVGRGFLRDTSETGPESTEGDLVSPTDQSEVEDVETSDAPAETAPVTETPQADPKAEDSKANLPKTLTETDPKTPPEPSPPRPRRMRFKT